MALQRNGIHKGEKNKRWFDTQAMRPVVNRLSDRIAWSYVAYGAEHKLYAI